MPRVLTSSERAPPNPGTPTPYINILVHAFCAYYVIHVIGELSSLLRGSITSIHTYRYYVPSRDCPLRKSRC